MAKRFQLPQEQRSALLHLASASHDTLKAEQETIHLTPYAYSRRLAEIYGFDTVDLLAEHITPALCRADDLEDYTRIEAIPFLHQDTPSLAITHISAPLLDWIEKHFQKLPKLFLTSKQGLQDFIALHFSHVLNDKATQGLFRLQPVQSAKQTITQEQKHRFTGFGIVFLGLLLVAPQATFLWSIFLIQLFYFFTLAFKCLLVKEGAKPTLSPLPPPARIDDSLPRYTILIPLHREAEVVPSLIAHMNDLCYPKEKLDIKLVVEADDHATQQAILAMKPERHFEMIKVPESYPRTKPKACNYALHFAKGEFVVIYDAEDLPEKDQLLKAVAAFRISPPHIACFQARLNYYNEPENLLTRLFSLEYSNWFDQMLKGLERLRIPIPLGGTSNHLRLSTLREVGAWDPYNVTEDADLGLRLAMSRYQTSILDSYTFEEAPITLKEWLQQRSRWIKGYMQTWLVHTRSGKNLRHFSPHALFGFHFFIGGPCLVFLSTPVLWLICLAYACLPLPITSPVAWWAFGLSSANLLFGLAAHSVFAFMLLRRASWRKRLLLLGTYPFYWGLHSVASFKAFWELCVKPHYWAKTTHGLSSLHPRAWGKK